MFKKIQKWLKKTLANWGGFFKNNSDRSMMRLGMFMCVCAGIAYPFYAHFHKGHIDTIDFAMASAFITLGITGKAYQKGKEIKKDETTVRDDQEA
jgi:cellobiose-specific phosphotransferase system component IIC